VLYEQHHERWAAEDAALNEKLSELQSKHGQPPNIVDVASRWGFWHMGQLAADYRKHFGELPSETLRSATGGVVRWVTVPRN